jgi:hypothetical protein
MDDLVAETAPRFVPLRIDVEASGGIGRAVSEEAPAAPFQERPLGSIEIEIGSARVRIEGAVDPGVLRQVLCLIGPAR